MKQWSEVKVAIKPNASGINNNTRVAVIGTVCSALIGLGVSVMVILAANPHDSSSFEPHRAAVSRISGWTEQKEQYRYFTTQDFYGIIDGGAAEHEKQGMKSGIGISLTNGAKSLNIYFEDFGTSSRAKGMVGVKKKSCSDPENIPEVKAAPAIYEEVIGGCIVYWAKGHYYIEMRLTGYDSTKIAVHDAVVLLIKIYAASVTNSD
jgi:hypothetical protein